MEALKEVYKLHDPELMNFKDKHPLFTSGHSNVVI